MSLSIERRNQTLWSGNLETAKVEENPGQACVLPPRRSWASNRRSYRGRKGDPDTPRICVLNEK